MGELKTNVLYFGDNLEILRRHIPDGSIDLIYLDPPFNSQKDYNLLFKENGQVESESQIKAFTDSWHWTQMAENTCREIVTRGPLRVGKLIGSLHDAIGDNDVMAYLVMMTARLIELHRVLKPTGSLYLHCDPTASHYLKLVLDQIFGPANFRNEIVWCYLGPARARKDFPDKHDVIFRYGKGTKVTFNPDSIRIPYSDSFINRRRYAEGKGGIYKGRLRSQADTEAYKEGKVPEDWWIDIPTGGQLSRKERLGYETQKPLKLLERIIKASSNEGDIVLDPFCGGGTALVAAQRLNRRWLGIDITHLAINLMRNRLKDSFGIKVEVIGEPVDLAGARALARQDRYQFQWWALGLIGARPLGEKKRGADRGIDGVIHFIDKVDGQPRRVVVQVKSGHIGANAVRELKAVVANEAMGVLITLEPPAGPMEVGAGDAGFYHSPIWDKDYPKIQILTIADLLGGKAVDMPPQTQTSVTFTRAPEVAGEEGEQLPMVRGHLSVKSEGARGGNE